MKARKNLPTRVAALLLALLLLATAGLTACDKTNDPTGTDPSDTIATQAPENGGDMTLPEGTAPADPEAPTDPADTPATPEAPDSLIGDGSPLVEIYPTFSEVGGYYTARAKTVEITAPEGYTVRYTTDGSVPTKRSAAYTEAIQITADKGEGTTIRAACFDADGKLTGQVITHTYISAKTEGGLHYTVMLSCDEDDLKAMGIEDLYYVLMEQMNPVLEGIMGDERFVADVSEASEAGLTELAYWSVSLPQSMEWEQTEVGGEYRVDFYGKIAESRVLLYTIYVGGEASETRSVIGVLTVDGEEKAVLIESYPFEVLDTWTEADIVAAGEMMDTVNANISAITALPEFSDAR